MRLALVVARVVALLVLGAAVGVASVLLHGLTLGLLLGVVATALTAVALPGGPTRRFPFVIGWVAGLAGSLLPRGGGGFLIAADVRGYALLAFGLVLLLVAIVTLRPLRPSADDPGPEPPGDGAAAAAATDRARGGSGAGRREHHRRPRE